MIEIIQFQEEYALQAANIFTANYCALMEENPHLPPDYHDSSLVARKLAQTVAHNPGVIAIENGKMVGYLTGYSSIPSFKGSVSGTYMPEWAHGVLGNRADVYYSMYQEMAKRWVEAKCYNHAITVLAGELDSIDLFHNLGFGTIVIDAIRSMESVIEQPSSDYVVREARIADLPEISKLDQAITQHLASSPNFLFLPMTPSSREQLVAEYFGENRKTYVATGDNEILAYMKGNIGAGAGCDIVTGPHSLGIDGAYTKVEWRGKKVAANLLNTLICWGKDQGMERCSVDFESSNREGAGFWLRHFQPVCISLMRKIDDRL